MSNDSPRRSRGSSDHGGRGSSKGRAEKGGPPRSKGGAPRGKSGPPRGKGGPPREKGGPRPDRGGQDRREDTDLAGPLQWGRIARRGAGNMDYDDPDLVKKRPPRKPKPSNRSDAGEGRPSRPDRELPTADDLQRSAAGAVKRGRGKLIRERKPLAPRPRKTVDPAVALRKLVGEQRAKSLNRRVRQAGGAFDGERFQEVRTLLQPVVREAPELPEGRELMGLAHYRLGRWKDAIDQLERFRDLSGSTEQHPVLADCYRALGRWGDVEELWNELGEASPSAELVIEGRIVFAGAKADQGDIAGALRILEQGWKPPKRPRSHHLRRAYALADLYDRAGRAPRARELFKWVAGHDPELADVEARVKALD